MEPLVLQGLAFSAVDLGLVVLSVWWFFLSPLRKAVHPNGGISRRLATVIGLVLIASGIQFFIGAMWDTSMHIKTGEVPGGADFLWPPHLMIYSGFLVTLALAIFGLASVAIPALRRGERDPRRWVRGSPYLGALAIASLYALASVPGDAIWHELFGIDLTAWSPPHLFLGLATCATLFSGVGLLARAFPLHRQPAWAKAVMVVLFGLILNIGYFVAAVEWETPGIRNPLVAARPIWLYPLVAGIWLFLVLYWTKRAVRWRWAATAAALVFLAFRLVGGIVIALTDNIPLGFPLLFLGGALMMDLAGAVQAVPEYRRDLLLATAFAFGYGIVTSVQLILRPALAFTPLDSLAAYGLTLVAATALVHLARFAANRMFGDEMASLPQTAETTP